MHKSRGELQLQLQGETRAYGHILGLGLSIALYW
jgi:hypothetical protein